MYRHALPPGFVLQKAAVQEEEEAEEIPIEVQIEEEVWATCRAAIGVCALSSPFFTSCHLFLSSTTTQRKKLVGGTPVTAETFAEWKERRRLKKEQEERTRIESLRKKAEQRSDT